MTQYIDPKDDQREVHEHESFGMVRIAHVQGSVPLFGVDYPQQHYMSLEIKTGRLERDLNYEWFYAQNLVVEINLSEVQFARLVASPNTSGVPCTIRQRHTEGFAQMAPPPEHMASAAKWKTEIQDKAKAIGKNFHHCRKLVAAMEAKTPTKGQLKELAGWLQQTQQALESDMPYLAQCLEEKVDEGVNNAKAEVDAYIAMQLQELGRKALGQELKKGGVMIRLGGKNRKIEALEDKHDE